MPLICQYFSFVFKYRKEPVPVILGCKTNHSITCQVLNLQCYFSSGGVPGHQLSKMTYQTSSQEYFFYEILQSFPKSLPLNVIFLVLSEALFKNF